MTALWHAPAASPDPRHRSALARTAAIPALCLGAAAAFSATLIFSFAPAGANQVATLQQQAASIAQKMLFEQLQIGSDQQQRAAAMADVAADDAQLQQMQVQMSATQKRIAADLHDLRRAAVKAYVEGGTEAYGTSSLFSSAPTNGASGVYDAVMTGDLRTAVEHLQSDRRALRTEEGAQQALAAQAQQSLDQANALLASAQGDEQALSQQRVSITGELAVAVAQEQAQQQAAAQAAARAAAIASAPALQPGPAPVPIAKPAASPAAPATPVAPPGSALQAPSASTGALPPLPPFLACVIQAESGGDYQAVSPTGQYMGAFQFLQSTWNDAARLAGLPTLVGVRPDQASPRDQRLLAIALYNADGEQPWYDPCRS